MPKWRADQRLYLSQEGQVVGESAPGRKTLLCAVGHEVTEAVCKQYGLGPYSVAVSELASEPEEPGGNDGGQEEMPPESTHTGVLVSQEPNHRHSWRKDGSCRCGATRE